MTGEITLSAAEFKALASETRIGVLKQLNERNHTMTELSQKMDLASPTIKQHLEQLEAAGLVESIDDGHKWKYYALTRKGRRLVQSRNEPLPVMLLLSTAGILILGLALAVFLQGPASAGLATQKNAMVNAPEISAPLADSARSMKAPEPAPAPPDTDQPPALPAPSIAATGAIASEPPAFNTDANTDQNSMNPTAPPVPEKKL